MVFVERRNVKKHAKKHLKSGRLGNSSRRVGNSSPQRWILHSVLIPRNLRVPASAAGRSAADFFALTQIISSYHDVDGHTGIRC
jgi:hypothetical protein